MSNCPVCGKAVDPIRAPAMGVKDGKVVAYCSREHAAEAETKPVKVVRPATEPSFKIPETDQKKNKKTRTPASGVAQPSTLLDSGPVIEIIHEPASGVVTSASDARSGVARTSPTAETSGAIQIADTGHLDDYVSADDKPRSKLWILAVVVVLGGGGFAAYKLINKPKSTEAPVVAPVAAAPRDASLPDAALVTPQKAIEQATVVLQRALASDSPRVQRIAASALARTGDTVAINALVAALAKETSDLAKLDIDYALARGGDKRGTDGLVAALQMPRRDVKAEAANRLALLGDKRAIDTLAQFLDISQLSLGAAEQLAFLAEPRAVKALEAIRADDKATPDEKARAAIALGYAGKKDIAPALKALLTDPGFNAFAAASLASLHDEAARPILVKQLQMPSLGVRAARALRMLGDGDPTLLPPLVAALSSAKDTEQVQSAETVLLLAGPKDWSLHE